MKHYNYYPSLSLAFLATWVIASTLGIASTDHMPDTPYLAYALLCFTAVLATTNPFRFAAAAAVVVSLGVYNAAVYSLHPQIGALVLQLGAANLAILGTGLLGWNASRNIARLQQQAEHSNQVIHDLRIKDPTLDIVRLPYALQTLKTEVVRSQRYKSSLCLILLQIADEEEIRREKGAEATHEIRRQVCTVVRDLIREMDLLFGQANFGIILPETTGEAALVVARRITDSIARKVRVGIHIGIAEFNVDAFSDDELYHAAETALNLARQTDKAIVSYAQVRSVTEPELAQD